MCDGKITGTIYQKKNKLICKIRKQKQKIKEIKK